VRLENESKFGKARNRNHTKNKNDPSEIKNFPIRIILFSTNVLVWVIYWITIKEFIVISKKVKIS
jgi:hypothetical protein